MTLSLTKISKRFDNRWVLRDVSFTVSKGEVFGIFGVSGAGKTPLMDVISGKVRSNGGSIEYNDSDISNQSQTTRGFRMPSANMVSFWRRLLEKRPEPVDVVARMNAINTAIADASGVLLRDEPCVGFDDEGKRAVFEKLRRAVEQRNLAVVIASNSYDDILSICDRTAILINGEVRQIGDPQAVYESPESASVAAIVKKSNLFIARRLTSSKTELPEFQTTAGDHRIFTQKAARSSLAPLNQNVTLGIRPEHISIAFGASFPEDNLLKAKVSAIRFRGPTTVVEFDCDGLALEALVLRVVGLAVGDECMVGLPPDRIQIFKD